MHRYQLINTDEHGESLSGRHQHQRSKRSPGSYRCSRRRSVPQDQPASRRSMTLIVLMPTSADTSSAEELVQGAGRGVGTVRAGRKPTL
jgi:hypothetical protein